MKNEHTKITGRIVTEHDLKAASNAYEIYNRNKIVPGLTNSVIASKLNITQSAVSQYLTGNIAMGAITIMNLADIFSVDILDIDPNFNKRFRPNALRVATNREISVLGTTSGTPPVSSTTTVAVNTPRTTYAIEVDSDLYSPAIQKNTFIGADPLLKIKPSDSVLIRRIGESHFEVMQVLKFTGKSYKLTPVVSQYAAKKSGNKNYGTRFSMMGDVSLDLKQILTIHKITLISHVLI